MYAELLLKNVLVQQYDLQDISFTDLLRNKYRETAEPAAQEMQQYINNGEIVPIPILHALLKSEIEKTPKGILLRKYPRTAEQFNALKEFLHSEGFTITRFWHLRWNNIEEYVELKSQERDEYTEKFGFDKDLVTSKLKAELKATEELINYIDSSTMLKVMDIPYPLTICTEDFTTKL